MVQSPPGKALGWKGGARPVGRLPGLVGATAWDVLGYLGVSIPAQGLQGGTRNWVVGITICTRGIPGEPKASQDSHNSAFGAASPPSQECPGPQPGWILQTWDRDGRLGTPEQDSRVTPVPLSLQLLQVPPTAVHPHEFLPRWEWGQHHHLQPLRPSDTRASSPHQDLELEPGVMPCCTLPCREQERKSQRRGKLSEMCIFFSF